MAPSDRRPIPATRSDALPSLVDVTARREPGVFQPVAVVGVTGVALAAGMALAAPHDPVCGSNRVAELDAHGPVIASYLHQGRVMNALAELAVAIGWRAHDGGQLPRAPGEAPVVNAIPLVPPTPPVDSSYPRMTPGGAPPPVTEVPALHTTTRHHDRVGPRPTRVVTPNEGER